MRLPLWVQRPCPWWLHHWIRGRARVAVQCVCCVFCCVFPAAHYSLSGPVATRSFRFGSGSGGGSGGGSSGSPALLHRGSLGAASNPNPYPKKKLARVHFLIYFPEHKNDFLEKSGSENQGPDYYFTGTSIFFFVIRNKNKNSKKINHFLRSMSFQEARVPPAAKGMCSTGSSSQPLGNGARASS